MSTSQSLFYWKLFCNIINRVPYVEYLESQSWGKNMDYSLNSDGKKILTRIIGAIQENKEYLSEIDGRIGDGDHGINMNKGFSIFEERIRDRDVAFSDGLGELGEILLTEIGGSMGPIYGTIIEDRKSVV